MTLAGEQLSAPGDKGANAGLKVASLVAGMVAGAKRIDDVALLRHGGMGRVFTKAYAAYTLDSFLRAFTFAHVRQLDAVAARFLTALATQAPQVVGDGTGGRMLVDVDHRIIEVHGYAKQGAGLGHSRVRGTNALLATVTATAGHRSSWRSGCARDRAVRARGQTAGGQRAQRRAEPTRGSTMKPVAARRLSVLWGRLRSVPRSTGGRCRSTRGRVTEVWDREACSAQPG